MSDDAKKLPPVDTHQFPMIEHKGKMVHTTNSEGQRIHKTDAGIRAFHDWFGDESTHVDVHGRPKVLFHGTTKAAARNINSGSAFRRSSIGHVGPGIYLGDSEEASKGYNAGAMMKVYARGKYASNEDWSNMVHKHGWHGAEKHAKDAGYHGIHDTKHESAVAVWHPHDIKSAEKNSGEYGEHGAIRENLEEADDNHRRDLGKVAIVDRVRGGKIQIRKLVNETAGYKIVDATLQKMTPEEIRQRKRGAKVAVRKRKAESAKIDRNLHISLDKRAQRLS